MDVRTLRDRVVELSHHSLGNDVDINAKALAWVNSAYMELMNEIAPLAPATLQVREDVVTASDGAAVLSAPVQKLVNVVERGNNRVLDVVSPAELLSAEVDGLQGDPQLCSVSEDVVQVYPAKVANVSVVFVPRAVDLLESGSEVSILLPPSLHHVLVWGGLVWSALFERGFMSQSEVLMYQRQWLAGKEQVRLALLGELTVPVRVKPFTLV